MKKNLSFLLLAALILSSCANSHSPQVTTFAGNGVMGSDDGIGTSSSFANLMAIAADTAGNIYVADSHNNIVRKITPAGIVTTFAGSGREGHADGKGKAASFFNPAGIAVDKLGNVYVADTHNNLVRKITPGGDVTTIAGKMPGSKDSSVRFDNPAGIAVDDAGNIYVADWANDVVRKISIDGAITTFAGSGVPGSRNGMSDSASFYLPWGIAVDAANNIYVGDSYNNMIRKISAAGVVTTFAGKKTKGFFDGAGSEASFFHPAGIAIDKQGNVYVADEGNNKIRKITPGGIVTTFAGSGERGALNGSAAEASFYKPYGVAVDKDGGVYVADYQNNLVRKISF
jgi:sugar lactone lactonase YvrE